MPEMAISGYFSQYSCGTGIQEWKTKIICPLKWEQTQINVHFVFGEENNDYAIALSKYCSKRPY